MILGTGTISNYGSFISNCQLRQMPYKIPVNNLQDVQLFIDIGGKPDTILYQLIHTCGPNAGLIETLTTSSYVVGQNTIDSWYGVFKEFDDSLNELSCFVIAITLGFGGLDKIYFSEEYCIDGTCKPLTMLKGCYGNLDNELSYDCNNIYFGTHDGEDEPMGDINIIFKHELLLRGVEVTLLAIKNTFKQGRTRNFRTEKEKIFQFWAELVPEWYLPEVDAIFYRGEVFIGGIRYLVNETQFEKVEDCYKQWKPSATLKESCFQSFSCETDPCAPPPPPGEVVCCDPLGVTASVVSDEEPGDYTAIVVRVSVLEDETLCEGPSVTVYVPEGSVIFPGIIVYDDPALTIPHTGDNYIVDILIGTIYNLDSVTGLIESVTGNTC